MFIHGRKRWFAALVGLALSLVLVGCTNTPPQGSDPDAAPPSPQELGLPQVTPQPQRMERMGEDVAVEGKVELVVDPLVDEPTRELAAEVLRMAGASEVVVREPGPPAEDATLLVRVGKKSAPGVLKRLQGTGLKTPTPFPDEGYVLAVKDDEPVVVIGAEDPAGAYYGVQTLRQLASPGKIAGAGIVDYPSLPLRGAIEGFYGPPWTHQERMDQLAFYGDVKMNTYIYAPKDDPYHRERWREPYPPEELAEIRELIGQAQAHHVRFTFALSPGASICYSDPAEVDALTAKLQAMYDEGVRDFSVPLDDISYTRWNCAQDQQVYGGPSQEAAGRAHADLLNRVQQQFVDAHPDVAPLQTVSTEYSDVDDSPYKRVIREQLDPRVLVMWTGDGVIPRQITVADAEKANQVWGREVFLWDNYPVNDFDGSVGRLMLGPYDKREPGLGETFSGVVVNPMNQASASKVVEIGAADFSWNDEAFDPQRAWREAARYLAGDRFAGQPGLEADPAVVEALLAFFDLEHMAPLANGQPWLPPAPGLAQRIEDFRAQWSSGDRAGAVQRLREHAQLISEAPERIRSGAEPAFAQDADPWLSATDLWGDALLVTLDALQARADGDEPRAADLFARAQQLAGQAQQIRTSPTEVRPQGPVRVADGVLDEFVAEAPQLR
ncbi:beta-N-acetylglucosaminidase domain-containing protein [Saccharopolyspora rectivirgula]|uniref:beta-N-acetylglucosaminidase domain-containing protein n=1 Tax=Saccharopolyspora rectivirgula TaxID=28042 RepID=UPI000427B17C|nr:beta-N-acetylglucosaminidase domain-containing protein [Saccharopolyspora rectivirgula]